MTSLCTVVWLFVLCFAEVCPSLQKNPTFTNDRHNQNQHKSSGTKRFCNPSFSNQTAGAVTQKCGAGFYREWTGPHRGQCVPCSCNKLSDECDEQTGSCLNCQFNTTGDRCERCKEGYYGNAANRSCRACPCPLTWNNFAVACMDVGSGVVECLCKPGYSGARCERCAHGYYGNTMVTGGDCKPCNCKDDATTVCNSITGACITSGNSSCGDHCNECDSCSDVSLDDAEKLDNELALVKQQVQNISQGPDSLSSLNKLNANTSETKIVVGRYRTAVRHLDPKVEQLEADMRVVRYDVNQLTDETLQTALIVRKVLHSANETKLKAGEVVFEAESLFTAVQGLIKNISGVKLEEFATLSEHDKVSVMEEARNIVQEMRGTGCTAQRVTAGREQETAHGLFHWITNNMTSEGTAQAVLNQTAQSLMLLESSLNVVAELLSDAGEKALNPKSTSLQHLQLIQTQLQGQQAQLFPVMEMTKDCLRNVTNIFPMLQEIKKEDENHAAQLHGAKWELLKILNKLLHTGTRVKTVTEAGEHAEELSRTAAEFQQGFSIATSMTDLLTSVGTGAYNNFVNAIEKAEIAANESRWAADQALKIVEEEDLSTRAEGLRDISKKSIAEVSEIQRAVKRLSRAVNNHQKRVSKQKKKGGSLRTAMASFSDGLEKIRGADVKALIDAAKTAASTSNSTANNITERLKNITQEVERVTLTRFTEDDSLIDAQKTLKTLHAAFPVLKSNLTQVAALSRMAPPSANLTESIQKIKEVIEETRNLVNRLSAATAFNGSNHVELHPPKNLEDIKAFTAVDLLLNRHRTEPPSTNTRRMRRQDERDNLFVFYLGNKDASGDYIGMAVRNNVLVCVYKLGGVVHELETAPVTTATRVNSSDFDRVVFHRVYQDAEVNMTQNFTSQMPVSLPPNRNLPNTMSGVLDLHTDSVVFYVGGYPEDFTPPVELRYPRYRGAVKLSYINDIPVCLFNYKHAVNMDAKQPFIKVAQSEVSDYYDGSGYRMAFVKEPNSSKRRLFKFHTYSRETNALLFYIGNEEAFSYACVEKGFLVLYTQQAGQELRARSERTISLFDQLFAIVITNKFIVQYGAQQILTDHSQTSYTSFFIGGLPAALRQRHNITAPALRGCVDHLTVDGERAEYNWTVGVTDGCPVSLLGVRSASLYSVLSVDSLFAWDQMPLRVSLGFRTTDRHGALVSGGSQSSTSAHNLQLSLADGYLVLNSDNYTLKSDKRYSDGSWHYLSAVRRPTGLELSVDNGNVVQGQPLHRTRGDENSQSKNFTGCIANLYSRRLGPEQSFTPADLGSLSQRGDVVLGPCGPHRLQHAKHLPAPELKPPQKLRPSQAPAVSQCRGRRAGDDEHHLYGDHSWLSYTLPQDDLNYRPHFSLDFKTKSSKGLLFHVAGRGAVPLWALYMANGKIKMSLGLNRIIQHSRRSDDDNWHRVEFSVERSSFHLLVDGLRVTDGQLSSNEGSSLELYNPVYLGGDLHTKATKGHSVPMNSVIGCVRNFKMNDVLAGEPEASHNTLPCVEWHAGMGTFFGGGHVVLDNYFPTGSDFELAFELRPQHLTGLLFHVRSNKTNLDVFLLENMVGVKVKDGKDAFSVTVTPHQSLCDEKFHAVTVSKQRGVIRLEVDSLSEQKAGPSTSVSSQTLHALHIGGTTKYSRVPVSSPFVGCLRNVNVNGRPVAFETESRVIEPVSINRCPVY